MIGRRPRALAPINHYSSAHARPEFLPAEAAHVRRSKNESERDALVFRQSVLLADGPPAISMPYLATEPRLASTPVFPHGNPVRCL